ncbi:hypothetical protein IFM89_006565 [Coptis chinensis]|uniref:Uncharacterized protein n=1 Tax=Coptis chinensis TaxID=261450 RepID=A0A835IPM0_9MAGN|nr:hypothetical protein IFM89_006565 [Coptis chinensis]
MFKTSLKDQLTNNVLPFPLFYPHSSNISTTSKGVMAREGPCYVPQRSSPFVSPTVLSACSYFYDLCHTELNSWQRKRMKFSDDPWLNGLHDKLKYKRGKSLPDIADHSDPFSVPNLMEELDLGIYGSVTKDIEDLCARRFQMLQPAFSLYPALSNHHPDFSHQSPTSGKTINFTSGGIIDLDDDCVLICPDAVEDSKPACKSSAEEMLLGHGYKSIVSLNDCQIHNNSSVVILDSDDEESAEKIGMAQASTCNLETLSSEIPQGLDANQKASWQYEEVILKRQIAENPSTDFADAHRPMTKMATLELVEVKIKNL